MSANSLLFLYKSSHHIWVVSAFTMTGRYAELLACVLTFLHASSNLGSGNVLAWHSHWILFTIWVIANIPNILGDNCISLYRWLTVIVLTCSFLFFKLISCLLQIKECSMYVVIMTFSHLKSKLLKRVCIKYAPEYGQRPKWVQCKEVHFWPQIFIVQLTL
jgi:hypothetical protein